MSIFTYGFMIRALVGALVVGVAAPAVGIYLVQRRLSLIGDGIGHVALVGVGLGFLLQTSPVLTAVAVAALGAVAVELVRERGRTSGDVALALMFYGGIAGGVLLISLQNRTNASLLAYLFGSLLTTSTTDLAAIAVLGAAVLAVTLLVRPWLFAICQDEEYARVSGVPVRLLNITLAVTTAVTVTVAMRAVGLLLVSALLVVPVATAQQVSRGFRTTMHTGMALGLVAAATGVWFSARTNAAPGAAVVVTSLAQFAAVTATVAVMRRWRRYSADVPVETEPPDVVLGRKDQ